MEPFVLFGSSFPKDKNFTQVGLSFVCMACDVIGTFFPPPQVCRNINQIKICMETGRTVILLNLDNLYESLYDLLNQVCAALFLNSYITQILLYHVILLYSIISNLERTAMWTLGYRLIGSNVECTTISSELIKHVCKVALAWPCHYDHPIHPFIFVLLQTFLPPLFIVKPGSS